MTTRDCAFCGFCAAAQALSGIVFSSFPSLYLHYRHESAAPRSYLNNIGESSQIRIFARSDLAVLRRWQGRRLSGPCFFGFPALLRTPQRRTASRPSGLCWVVHRARMPAEKLGCARPLTATSAAWALLQSAPQQPLSAAASLSAEAASTSGLEESS